ncbi:MAG TPA: IncP-type conjugal transfer protein TraG [Hyphomonadaceae bacterium]|nr:IncP-type conjugal transfer protein TraG [Hyphomonadaceae bacterium]
MSAGRIYWGQIVCVLAAFIASLVVTTQWTADALGYQSQLGAPDIVLFGYPLYAPWKFFLWWYAYDAYARSIFETGALLFLAGVAFSVATAFGFSLWRAREAKDSATYGSARWATARDARKLQLTNGDGVVLGTLDRQLLRHDGDEHVLVIAPTNTGKSVGISLPTGLVWRHSYLALDLKGENWSVTSGLRKAFGPVYRFAPTTADTHRYNPLTQIRRGEAEVRDAQVLADMLVDPEGALRERSHWQLRAFELLVATILWTLYAEKRKSLARVGELLADPTRPVLDLFDEMLRRPIKDGAAHPVVAAGARQLLDMADAERSGVVSTALGFLSLYRDPVLARATEASDFSIEELITGPRPVSLYLVVPPEEMSRLKALLRLMINQILKRLTEIASQNTDGRRVLLMLDEFPQLGKLDFFEHALAYIRGYRIKACLVAQSLNQLVQTYGENSSILDNAHVRVAFACNDERTARRISDMLGVTTETRAQMNYAGSRMAPWLGHTMVSRQEVPRPLLTPGEVMQLPHADALILTGGAPPIRAKKVRYFSEPVFQARLLPPYASPRHSANGLPTAWSNLFAPDTPLSPRPKPTAAKRTSAPTHGQNHQALQNTFDFSSPVSGEAAQTNATASQSAANPSDDLGAAFTGPTLAGTAFALDPDHFDTDV